MADKIRLKPGQKVALKITPDERELLFQELIWENEDLRLAMWGSADLQLTLDELEELGGCVAEAYDHTENHKLEKKLERIGHRIDGLLELFEEG